MRGAITLGLGAICLTAFTSHLYAQPSITSVGNTVRLATGVTASPIVSIAYNTVDDEFLAVWADANGKNENDIFGQRIAGGGNLLGVSFPVTDDSGSQFDPFVSFNTRDNNYLVAWEAQFGAPGSTDFNNAFGRLVTSDGRLLGKPFHISAAGQEISIAYNSRENQHLVAGRAWGANFGIVGQLVSGAGELVGNLGFYEQYGAPSSQAVYNSRANEYLVTWRTIDDLRPRAARVSSTAAMLGTPFFLSDGTSESAHRSVSVSYDVLNDRYLTVFQRFQGTDIVGQFVSAAGELLGGAVPIGTTTTRFEPVSVVHSDLHHLFLVVWKDGTDIVGQLLTESGESVGERVTIARDTAGFGPAVAQNTQSGEFLLAWTDSNYYQYGKGDILAQRIAISEGTSQDGTPPVLTGMPASGCSMPPNKHLVSFTIEATDVGSGIAAGAFNVAVSSNEPYEAGDVVITPTGASSFLVQLRAQRISVQQGRVYTLMADATDVAGNHVTATSSCMVGRTPKQ